MLDATGTLGPVVFYAFDASSYAIGSNVVDGRSPA
jgi:hypothetical protein